MTGTRARAAPEVPESPPPVAQPSGGTGLTLNDIMAAIGDSKVAMESRVLELEAKISAQAAAGALKSNAALHQDKRLRRVMEAAGPAPVKGARVTAANVDAHAKGVNLAFALLSSFRRSFYHCFTLSKASKSCEIRLFSAKFAFIILLVSSAQKSIAALPLRSTSTWASCGRRACGPGIAQGSSTAIMAVLSTNAGSKSRRVSRSARKAAV
jgi:hypothetical protein